MAKKEENNFKKAMNELLGAGGKDDAEPVREEKPEPAEEEAPKIDFSFQREPEVPTARREEAIIPSDMVINGNITTSSNMKIMGSIVGDVECEGNIFLLGNIQGNVSAANLTIQNGGLTGDVFAQENIMIEQGSALIGNLEAQNIYSNAKTEGRIHASGAVELRERAFVEGDITAGTLSVNAGAKIKGMVEISG